MFYKAGRTKTRYLELTQNKTSQLRDVCVENIRSDSFQADQKSCHLIADTALAPTPPKTTSSELDERDRRRAELERRASDGNREQMYALVVIPPKAFTVGQFYTL